jgi:hypothetical protein
MALATRSGQAACIGGVLLVTPLLTTKADAQQLYFPWTPSTTTQNSGTITNGGTFQTALVASGSRKGCLIQNKSTHTMDVYLGALASATDAKSVQLTALGGGHDTFNCNQGVVALTDNVNIETSGTGDAYVVLSW